MQRIVIVLAVIGLGLGSYLLAAADSEKDGAKKPAHTPKHPPKKDTGKSPKVINEKEYHKSLMAIAKAYKEYGRVEDLSRWAPTLCRRPPATTVRPSASEDEATHGKKLYFLYAKNRDAYVTPDMKKPHPVGTTIVKESYATELVPDDEAKVYLDGMAPYTNPQLWAIRDGKVYRATKIHGLFVMTKVDPKVQKSDEGWIYGTLTPDGKKVTSAGRVASCMKCHKAATHDRLFGLPKKPVRKIPPHPNR